MAPFNISLDRGAEWYWRVRNSDPSQAAFVVLLLATSGLEADETLLTKDTLAAVLAGSTNEITNTNYSRAVLRAADIVDFTPDDVNNLLTLDLPNVIWTNILGGGDTISRLVIGLRKNNADADSAVLPMTLAVFLDQDGNPIVPDGNFIEAEITGFRKAVVV